MFAGANVGSFAVGVAVGSIGTLIGVRITNRKTMSGSGNVVDQSGAKAGGDVVGRDKNAG
jgi:hypothetical protein